MATVALITRSSNSRERSHSLRLTYTNNYRVVVSTTHDKTRKEYRTNVSCVQVEEALNGFVIEKSIGSIFDKMFLHTINTTPCNRFSDTSFANAIEVGVTNYFSNYEGEYMNAIADFISADSFVNKNN
ncbi:hypothetical protein UFOVP964_106 [uncultured Caudovirales phage]|uniref:Uncharacterized protein n=1 Tax=uncultured Caudovirales phage TaxID=2100421 RepID=A0A6J5RHN0_9CAUD|nr:hypothetical protein UFOVP854_106 [uncultured Caudovirales phage]CAB4174984.1 hypothetical protein UFOVP964_106 [uncultured Caudovirales phage]CAB4179264.1 hypothetical protein UFOVP1034_52 [uncultured Caudovirales phage]CAB4189096.1 hypothetical protein UFOVP1177_52 [uncultured Caudovirales phage]CAB4193208.1 hypothetical protein UFOVP1243_39 [uncultured Caudovirales phage]